MPTNSDAKILVIDDEEIIRTGCQRILNEDYSHVDVAENGEEGWTSLQKNIYDLVLLDLMMPGIGGLAVLEKIREYDDKIVTIVITGFATIETAVDAMRRGAYDYLPKPFTPDEMRTKVSRGLEKRWLTMEADRLRKERDRNLLECSNEKSRTLTIINCLSEGLIATNRTGQIVLMNPAAMRMIRPKDGQVIGKQVFGLIGNPDLEKHIAETLEQVTRTAELTRMQFNTSDGRVLQSHTSPIIDDQQYSLGTVTVLLDITEDKKIAKIKSDFVRLVSHELKSPVAAIEGYLNLILDGLTAQDRQKETDIIRRSRNKAASLLELINDLLDLSGADREPARASMKPVDIALVLTDTLAFYQNEAQSKSIALEMHLAPAMPQILGNPESLSRVFANLVSNALKYTPAGGRVKVKAELQDGQLRISVHDTGIGIAAEDLDKIFDEFYRCQNAVLQKISGTGLGLSIARRIVEDHRGYMEVESELHKGSVFHVVLPVIAKK